jgi:hypothetical protein
MRGGNVAPCRYSPLDLAEIRARMALERSRHMLVAIIPSG